jgi:hypothetical protein
MTAIEVLAATVLASLMLAAVAGLLGGLSRQERILRAKSDSPPWHQQFIEELSWDLQNSRQFSAASNLVRLEGFAARDFATGTPTGRPAVIEYFLIAAANDRWLVRRETHPDELRTGASRTEVVCRGIERMQWGATTVDTVAESAAMIAPTATLATLPDRIAVQLYESGSTSPVFDRTVQLR